MLGLLESRLGNSRNRTRKWSKRTVLDFHKEITATFGGPMKRAPVTTHILDLVTGRPSSGVSVALFFEGERLAQSETDDDGRIASWNSEFRLERGTV